LRAALIVATFVGTRALVHDSAVHFADRDSFACRPECIRDGAIRS